MFLVHKTNKIFSNIFELNTPKVNPVQILSEKWDKLPIRGLALKVKDIPNSVVDRELIMIKKVLIFTKYRKNLIIVNVFVKIKKPSLPLHAFICGWYMWVNYIKVQFPLFFTQALVYCPYIPMYVKTYLQKNLQEVV